MLGSLSPEIVSMVQMATAAEAFTLLRQDFFNRSPAGLMQLKDSLDRTTLGSKTITQIFNDIKGKVDELAMIDTPISDDDVTLYVFNGLKANYRDIASTISTREIFLTFVELYCNNPNLWDFCKRLE